MWKSFLWWKCEKRINFWKILQFQIRVLEKEITINWVSRLPPNYFFISTVIHAVFFPLFLNGLRCSYRFCQAPVSHARPVCRSELLVVDYFGLLLMLCLNHHALQKGIASHYCSWPHLFIGDWSPCILLMQWWKVIEWAYALADKMYLLMNNSALPSVVQWSLCSGCSSRSCPQWACRVCYAFSNWPLFATFGKLIGDLNCWTTADISLQLPTKIWTLWWLPLPKFLSEDPALECFR